jgi:Zn-dependent peptidase ImmA (M78 family)
LFDGVNPATRSLLRDLSFSPSVDAADMAGRVRGYLGIDLARQQAWRSTDEALKHWRAGLEDSGIFVFKDSFNPPGRRSADFGDSPFSGFCLYDREFPVIYANNNNPKTRQIFTLFHETAHLLMHTGGVDTRQDDYIRYLRGDNRRIEVLCNHFAAEFLVPSRDFQARSAGRPVDDRAVSDWADLYRVSRETILRRLLDQGRVSRQYYEEKAHQWYMEASGGGEPGGSHYRNRGVYLGERYIEAVFSRYHQGRISIEEAADYLGEKTRNVPGMEEWLFRQESTM